MSLSSTAAQQRDRQTRLSHPVVACGIMGSIVFHASIFPVLLFLARREPPPQPAQIEIVVTEPIEPILEEPEAAIVEEETIDEAQVPSPSIQEPAPTPIPPTVPETPIQPEQIIDEVESEVAEELPNPQLNNVLEDIRRQRRQRISTRPTRPSSSGDAGEPSGNNDQAAAGPAPSTAPPSGGGSRTVACRSCPKPSYPRSALDAGAEGTVNIMVDINSNGNVTSASLVGSSGNSALDQAALSTVRRRWRFRSIRGGASGVVISVVMTIQGSDLNRRARDQGDNTSVEVPSPDTVAEDTNENNTSTATDPSSAVPSETPASTPTDTLTAPPPVAPSDSAPASPASSSADSQSPSPAAESSFPSPQPEPTVEAPPNNEPLTPEAPSTNTPEPANSQPDPQPEPSAE